MALSSPFTFGERLGLIFIVEAACLSAMFVTFCLAYIGYSYFRIKQGAERKWSFATHVHIYFLSLLIADLIQATGGILNIKWVAQSSVVEGAFCTIQGALKQIGDVTVSLTSLTIAVHTFCVLVFRWNSQPCRALFVVSSLWVFIAIIVGVSFATHQGEDYYGNTGCWINAQYPKQRIILDYLWICLAAFINVFVYAFLALVIKGFVTVDGCKVRFSDKKERVDRGEVSMYFAASRLEKHNGLIAFQMLFYPAVYLITVLPITVVRFIAFSGIPIPFAATAFSDILFALSGTLNVLLFTLTRPRLLRDRSTTPTARPGTSWPYFESSRPCASLASENGYPNRFSWIESVTLPGQTYLPPEHLPVVHHSASSPS